MTPGSKGDDQNDAASSQSPTEEITAMKRQTTSTGSLISLPHLLSSSSETPGDSFHAPSLPTLPFDLVEEILCRLPVKCLLQFRCVCKSWNSLISDDSQFARKHLRMSTTRHRNHLILSSTNSSRQNFLLWDCPIPSVLSSVPTDSVTQAQLSLPLTLKNRYGAGLGVSTCDGMLCFAIDQCFPLLWNPSIRKFKILPPLENPRRTIGETVYSFGYDDSTNNYKIVAVSSLYPKKGKVVNVYTLGTDSWRRIPNFPPYGLVRLPGTFVSGTLNWVAFDGSLSSKVIISLDLKKESCQKLLRPNYQNVNKDTDITLGVWRDCLCVLSRGDSDGSKNMWLMKEYGNQESWTKMFTIPHTGYPGYWAYTKFIHISEDGQVLLEFMQQGKKLIVYDSRNGTFKIPEIQNINGWMLPEVYVESLISPF